MSSPSDNYFTNSITAISIVGVICMLLRLGHITAFAMMGTFAAVSIITLFLELRSN